MPNLAASVNDFGFDLLGRIICDESDARSIVLAPLNLWMTAALTANAATGEHRGHFTKALHSQASEQSDLNRFSASTLEHYHKVQDTHMATAVWMPKEYQIRPEFLDAARRSFAAIVEELDFSRPRSITTVNKWASRATRGKIPTILDSLPEGRVVITSAAYLKALWASPFDVEMTRNESFHGQKSVVEVPMMHDSGNFRYTKNDKLEAVLIPYKTPDLRMIFVLPEKTSSLKKTVQHLRGEGWTALVSKLQRQEGSVAVPRFKAKYENSRISQTLADMGGVKDSGLVLNRLVKEPVPLEAIIHKAVIEVDEKGTEAAAVTGMLAPASAPDPKKPPPFRFVADRPFLFILYDEKTRLTLFAGAFVQP